MYREGRYSEAHMRRLISLILALAAVTILAGCGGSGEPSRAEYERAVVSARNTVDDALKDITSGVETREQLADRLAEAAVFVERAADDLDETGSAKGFEDETRRLVQNLEQLSTDLTATAEQFRDVTFEQVFPHTRALQFESWTKANRILRDLRDRGLDVKPWA